MVMGADAFMVLDFGLAVRELGFVGPRAGGGGFLGCCSC